MACAGAGAMAEPTLAEAPGAALLASQQDDSGHLDLPAPAQPSRAQPQVPKSAYPASLESILAVSSHPA